MLPSRRGLPLTSNTLGAWPSGRDICMGSVASSTSPVCSAFVSIAVTGATIAVVAAATADFLIKSLLSIV